MMLLAVDTSTAQMGLALIDGAQLAAETIWYSHQHHTIELAPSVAELLERIDASLSDVEAVAVATGPGSFTALRVGLALVKGIAIARKVPVIGVPTLDVLAAGQGSSTRALAAVLQAGRSRIAVVWYRYSKMGREDKSAGPGEGERGWEAQGAAEITTIDALARSIDRPTIVAGELTPEERLRLRRKKVNVLVAAPHLCVRRPSVLAEIGWARYQSGQVDDTAALSPIYLHINEPHHA